MLSFTLRIVLVPDVSLYAFADLRQIHASTMNFDPDNIIRVGTDLRFVDGSKPWDIVREFVAVDHDGS